MIRPSFLSSIMALAVFSGSSSAQAHRQYSHEFTNVSSVRVLGDGRMLVADRGEKRLVLLSTPDHDGEVVGRNGDGPLEYQVPNRLLAMGVDSTLMIDAQTGRWILLVGGKLAGAPNLTETLIKEVTTFPLVGWSARFGLYWSAGLPPSDRSRRVLAPGMIEEADSTVLLRRMPRATYADTLARLKGPFGGRSMVPRIVLGVKSVYMLNGLLRTPDQVAFCDDGWVAVLRADTPRVDWIDPNRQLRTGSRLPATPRAITARDKQQAIADFMGERVAPYFKPEEFPAWPTTVPAYASTGIVCDPHRHVLLPRFGAVGTPQLIDRVDRAGRVVRTYALPRGSMLMTVTRTAMVVVARDADDVQRIQLYLL